MTIHPLASPLSVAARPELTGGRRIGVLLSHGFTGQPASIKPWGESLAERGYAVEVPRLPGHGTTWEELNTRTWDDWYANADAALGSAKLQQKTAQENLDDASGTDQVRQATIALNQAKSQVSDASKARADIVDQIRLGTITSPIAGIVTAVNITKGLAAPSGDAIVVDADSFDVTASVVESDVAKMAVGQTAAVSVAAVGADLTGTDLRGTVLKDARVDPAALTGAITDARTITP